MRQLKRRLSRWVMPAVLAVYFTLLAGWLGLVGYTLYRTAVNALRG